MSEEYVFDMALAMKKVNQIKHQMKKMSNGDNNGLFLGYVTKLLKIQSTKMTKKMSYKRKHLVRKI